MKAAETKLAPVAAAPDARGAGLLVAQPASNELADNAPNGSIGAVAKNLSVVRRDARFKSAMLLISVVRSKSQISVSALSAMRILRK